MASYSEYVALDEASDIKLEYWAGEIVAVPGDTLAHSRLIANMSGHLRDALGKRRCLVFPSSQRVRIHSIDVATHPDAHVVLDTLETAPDDANALTNPSVIIHVLAEHTERRDSFAAYRQLPSLRHFVLVSQRERRIDVYTRDGRRWILDECRSGEQLKLDSIGVTLDVDAIYADAIGPIVQSSSDAAKS